MYKYLVSGSTSSIQRYRKFLQYSKSEEGRYRASNEKESSELPRLQNAGLCRHDFDLLGVF